ncbi:carbohydrate ABC transporter permease [Vallitalea pronyensis]|uniref:Carbohydrate ABC transporter permease n=1 Tax=Vallitalea pronyensis TaxID=1348613 RepID=A0A8J8MHN6_9FIRM|nr:carbohydrate ABC transporter permease [Vallitalea pronyensis]QUI21428.1 carbohydrate ABC transporter permease [Vallitalea pronyensis]
MKSKRFKVSNMLIYLMLFILGLLVILPFLWMISVSFERMANVQPPFPPKLIPEKISLFNYKSVFENGYLLKAYFNSFITTISSVGLSIGSAILAGYAFSKGKFRGKRLIFIFVLSTMMIPLQTRLIPMHKMFFNFGLLNTFWPIILPNILYGFGILLSKQFFDQLPNSLREAAKIDGAGEFATFFQIFMPLTGPITATMIILSFMANWNSFLWPLIVLTNQKMRTVPLFLATFSTESGERMAGLTMSLASASIIPILLVFLLLQKYIIESVALSGTKGE